MLFAQVWGQSLAVFNCAVQNRSIEVAVADAQLDVNSDMPRGSADEVWFRPNQSHPFAIFFGDGPICHGAISGFAFRAFQCVVGAWQPTIDSLHLTEDVCHRSSSIVSIISADNIAAAVVTTTAFVSSTVLEPVRTALALPSRPKQLLLLSRNLVRLHNC